MHDTDSETLPTRDEAIVLVDDLVESARLYEAAALRQRQDAMDQRSELVRLSRRLDALHADFAELVMEVRALRAKVDAQG